MRSTDNASSCWSKTQHSGYIGTEFSSKIHSLILFADRYISNIENKNVSNISYGLSVLLFKYTKTKYTIMIATPWIISVHTAKFSSKQVLRLLDIITAAIECEASTLGAATLQPTLQPLPLVSNRVLM